VAKWFERNFNYDNNRLKYAVEMARIGKPLEVYPPWQTFKTHWAVCFDAAVLAKHSLNRINPSYRAEVIHLHPGSIPTHYVCGFYVGGKLYIMDYGVPVDFLQRGVWGPFHNLDEYVNTVYLKKSRHKSLKEWYFGWPKARSGTKW